MRQTNDKPKPPSKPPETPPPPRDPIKDENAGLADPPDKKAGGERHRH